MHRFPVSVALRQQRAIWEQEGYDIKGPTYAEEFAVAAADRELKRLQKFN